MVLRQELLFLYNLVECRPILLGYALANFTTHKGQHVSLGAIFVGPYIIRLTRGIGLVDLLQRQEVVSGTSLLGLDTLQPIRW